MASPRSARDNNVYCAETGAHSSHAGSRFCAMSWTTGSIVKRNNSTPTFGLSLLERAPAHPDVEQQRGQQRDQRRQNPEEADELGRAEQERHADGRQRREVEREIEAEQRQQHDRCIEHADRDPLAERKLDRRRRRRQQRLERASLALAGGRVERGRHAAHHRCEQTVERDQKQNQRAGLLRRGEIDVLELERTRDLRRDAPQQQALSSPQAVVRGEQRFRGVDRGRARSRERS